MRREQRGRHAAAQKARQAREAERDRRAAEESRRTKAARAAQQEESERSGEESKVDGMGGIVQDLGLPPGYEEIATDTGDLFAKAVDGDYYLEYDTERNQSSLWSLKTRPGNPSMFDAVLVDQLPKFFDPGFRTFFRLDEPLKGMIYRKKKSSKTVLYAGVGAGILGLGYLLWRAL